MSKCVSCKYALYDGMCMAKGKYTVLDADSCELYRPTQGHEVARLKRDNAKLRELVRIMYYCNLPQKDCDKCAMNGADMEVQVSDIDFCEGLNERMRELGIEV